MRNALLIASLDFRRLRMLPVTAAALGLLVLFARFLPRMHPSNFADVTLLCALITAYSLGIISAFTAGGTLFAKELSEKRLSFLYARPLSTFSIVAGKVFAAAAIVGLTFTAAITPALLVYGRDPKIINSNSPGKLLLGTIMIMVVVAVLSHLTNLGFNDKSVWFLVSFIALTAGGAVNFLTIRQFLIPPISATTGTILVEAPAYITIVAIIVSILIGAVRGRALLRSVHRATAITLAVGMSLLVATVLGFAYWITHPSIHTINVHDIAVSPDNRNVVASGTTFGPPSSFLIDTTGSRAPVHLGAFTSDATFSADGKTLAWATHTRDSHLVHVWPLQEPKPRETTIQALSWNPPTLSPTGRYLAKMGRNVELYDLKDGDRLVKSIALPEDLRSHQRVEFVDEETLVLHYRSGTLPVTIRSIHGRPQISQTALLSVAGSFFSTDGSRMKTRREQKGAPAEHLIIDVASGATLWERIATNQLSLSTMFLPDGGLLIAEQAKDKSIWVVYDSSLQNVVKTFETVPLSIGASLNSNEISATTRWDEAKTEARKSYVVNWSSGTLKEVGAGLFPIGAVEQRYFNKREPAAGSLSTKLFRSIGSGSLILFDPLKGERRVLAGQP